MKINKNRGFTIVELLLVVVVIGILAAVTLVAYSGVSQKAVAASLQSDLSGASSQLKMFQVENGKYPDTISSDCVAQPTTTTNLCLKPSPGNTFSDYVVNNGSTPKTFSLTVTNTATTVSYIVTDSTQPTLVASQPAQASGWKQISASNMLTCGISYDDKAYCWGYNNMGQLGAGAAGGTRKTSPFPVDTTGAFSGKTVKQISAGEQYIVCAIASDDLAYCWGANYAGNLGAGLAYPGTTSRNVPTAVSTSGVLSGKTAKAISVGGWNNNCLVASDNQAYCWGTGTSGALGNSASSSSNVPVAVTTSGALSGKTVKYLSVGYNYACVVASDNKDYCWGSPIGSNAPVAQNNTVSASKPFTLGYWHTCYIGTNDLAYCYGDNSSGQFGDNTTNPSATPVAVNTSGVLSGKTIKAISASELNTCVIASDDKAYCWGDNTYGQIGNNSTSPSLVPVAVNTSGVLSGKTIVSISVGASHTCVIASDYNAYCWGLNSQGQLGVGNQNDSLVPVLTGSPI